LNYENLLARLVTRISGLFRSKDAAQRGAKPEGPRTRFIEKTAPHGAPLLDRVPSTPARISPRAMNLIT
jgi:hypothetical protein